MTKLTTVVVAAAAGFVAGILVAPKSGEDTRQEMKAKAVEAKRRAGKTADKMKKIVTSDAKAVKKAE